MGSRKLFFICFEYRKSNTDLHTKIVRKILRIRYDIVYAIGINVDKMRFHNSSFKKYITRSSSNQNIIQLEKKQVTPPFKPPLEDERDDQNFDPVFTDEPPILTPISDQ